MVDNISTKPCH